MPSTCPGILRKLILEKFNSIFMKIISYFFSRTRQISESSSKEGKKKRLGSRAKKLIKSKTSKGGSVRLRHTSSGGSSTDIYHPKKSKLPGKIFFQGNNWQPTPKAKFFSWTNFLPWLPGDSWEASWRLSNSYQEAREGNRFTKKNSYFGKFGFKYTAGILHLYEKLIFAMIWRIIYS